MIIKKKENSNAIENNEYEKVYEIIGKGEDLGNAEKHSVGISVIKKGGFSSLHYHPEAEESYYILKGKAKISINGEDYFLKQGDFILIKALEKHQIFNVGEEELEFIVVCSPPWTKDNSVFIN